MAESLGFCQEDLATEDNRQPNYCDKGGHKERSIYHAPQHAKHWAKEQRRERE